MAGNKGGKGRKLGRMEQVCKAYTAGGMQEKNKKRRMRRHILRNPEDGQALSIFENLWKGSSQIVVTLAGKPTGETVTRRAGRKLARKRNTDLQRRLKASRDARRHARRVALEKLKEAKEAAQGANPSAA